MTLAGPHMANYSSLLWTQGKLAEASFPRPEEAWTAGSRTTEDAGKQYLVFIYGFLISWSH